MFKEAIYHRPKSEYAYSYNEETVIITVRAKKDDMQKVTLIFGDSHERNEHGWVKQLKRMEKVGTDANFDWWSVEVKPEHKRLRYGFLLESERESVTFTEKGFYKSVPSEDRLYFCFPYIHPTDIISPPDWVKNTVWYQIFPERFSNGDQSINPPDTLEWGSASPTYTNMYGGDLKGVIDRLDYLEDLGINGIYLTPIFKAFSNHKYDTIDYLEIDPQFGDKETFRSLVIECHKRNIKVMLDAVFNHSGYFFSPFQDVLKHGENSRFKDWFLINQYPVEKGNYETYAFEPHMPKLNTTNEEVRDYLLNVGKYWVKEFNIDGWRLDVANEVDHTFWRLFRNEVKKIKSDIYILGEIWHDAQAWLTGDQFDAVMNYPVSDAIIQFFAYRSISLQDLKNELTKVYLQYPKQINEVTFNLLGSHDTERIISRVKGNVSLVKLQFLLLFSLPGTPCIYYGDEIGLQGGNDPDCRRCMEWGEENHDLELKTFMKEIIQYKKTHPAFHSRALLNFVEHPQLLMYEKEYEGLKWIFILNPDEEVRHFGLASLSEYRLKDIISGRIYEKNEDVILPPFGYSILELMIVE
ncbi:glycoside hydrolase family 13 protein [Sutcliffiella cohnii]|uniref:glycoside hydrolase family 13 protein n=1 Tax=Sutcliffiella cohnii TaxID=33932 RepID=UPI002E213CF1|nr:glycoside hydrolase family 13 protein [Sutcliffiella cohnii]